MNLLKINNFNIKKNLNKLLKRNYFILGIETSCDDTAAAVLDDKGNILSDIISSQWELNSKWKGINPALAARSHEHNIDIIINKAMKEGGLNGFSELSAVAVTTGPGLAPCLRVGLNKAKDIVKFHNLSFLSINHLEAHILISRLFHKNEIEFPFLTLLITGGHCMLIVVKDIGIYETIGTTLDDSIGEAFDKVARLLEFTTNKKNYGLHGGQIIENYANEYQKLQLKSNIKFTEPLKDRKDGNFSFSGLKSAVMREIEKKNSSKENDDIFKLNVSWSFQDTVTKHLMTRTAFAIDKITSYVKESKRLNLVICGGVAKNQYIRNHLVHLSNYKGIKLIFTPEKYCTDNAVMVAWAGIEKINLNIKDDVNTTEISHRWPPDTISYLT